MILDIYRDVKKKTLIARMQQDAICVCPKSISVSRTENGRDAMRLEEGLTFL